MVLAFPAGAGIETPGIPDGNPGIEAFLSFAMTSNINWIKIIIIIIIVIIINYHYHYYYYVIIIIIIITIILIIIIIIIIIIITELQALKERYCSVGVGQVNVRSRLGKVLSLEASTQLHYWIRWKNALARRLVDKTILVCHCRGPVVFPDNNS